MDLSLSGKRPAGCTDPSGAQHVHATSALETLLVAQAEGIGLDLARYPHQCGQTIGMFVRIHPTLEVDQVRVSRAERLPTSRTSKLRLYVAVFGIALPFLHRALHRDLPESSPP